MTFQVTDSSPPTAARVFLCSGHGSRRLPCPLHKKALANCRRVPIMKFKIFTGISDGAPQADKSAVATINDSVGKLVSQAQMGMTFTLKASMDWEFPNRVIYR